ncbi:hypothetical protein GCM10027614_00630 [Micromonospora vulcania]
MSDWTLGGNANGTPSYGNVVVAKAAYRLLGTSRDGAQPFLFATAPYQIPAGRTLVSVTLPTQTGDPGSDGRIHVFAIADDGTPNPTADRRTGRPDGERRPGPRGEPRLGHRRRSRGDGLPRPRPVG